MDAPLPHTDAMAPAPAPLSAVVPPPAAIIVATLPIHPGAGMLNAPPAAAGALPAADMPPAAVIA